MLKKLLSLLLGICLIAVQGLAFAQSPQSPETLTIGSVTELSGLFYTDLWGGNTADQDICGAIHGYGTVALEKSGSYAIDATVVKNVQVTEQNGNRTYTFTLNPELQWNDGTPLTARDYVFTILLQSSSEMKNLGVSSQKFAHVLGQPAFETDSATPFEGVRYLEDTRFSMTVLGEYLPNFYELMLAEVYPTPMHVVAPSVMLKDDGSGAYFVQGTNSEGAPVLFSQELLEQTLTGDNGYVRNPKVTCGAYQLESFDADGHRAVLTRNPLYLGNFEGKTPEIQTIVFRSVSNETMLDELQSGSVDILNKVSKGETIARGMELVTRGDARMTNYLRTGFGFLAYACEQKPTDDVAVRKALSMSMDADQICSEALNGYAMPVYGYYGLGQWMASQDTEALGELNVYGYDPYGAVDLLKQAGWIYNEAGQPFDPAVDTTRYCMRDGELTGLAIKWAKATGGTAEKLIEQQLTQASKQMGFTLEITEMTFSEMLAHYYRQTEREYNLFYLASNFNHVFDPYATFHTGDEYQGVQNTTGLRDEKLMELARSMRSVENGDVEAYCERWMAFQRRFVELLPMTPLYSNVYFDFFRPDLYGYDINTQWGWSAAILYATFTEPEPEIALETDGEMNFDAGEIILE